MLAVTSRLQRTPHSGAPQRARVRVPEACGLRAASRVRVQLRTLQRGENCICCSMAMSSDREAGIVSVRVGKRAKARSRHSYLAGFLLLGACAQSPTTDAVFDTGSSDPTRRRQRVGCRQFGSQRANGRRRTKIEVRVRATLAAHQVRLTANPRADAGVDAGIPKDASTSRAVDQRQRNGQGRRGPLDRSRRPKMPAPARAASTAHDAGTPSGGTSTGGGTASRRRRQHRRRYRLVAVCEHAELSDRQCVRAVHLCQVRLAGRCVLREQRRHQEHAVRQGAGVRRGEALYGVRTATAAARLFCAAPNGGCVDVIKSRRRQLQPGRTSTTRRPTPQPPLGRANAIGNLQQQQLQDRVRSRKTASPGAGYVARC